MVGITLSNVTKNFGPVTAVDNVSLEVRKGELFFLLGPSGCGKTTILRMIAGFETPDAGEIAFDAKPVSKVPVHKRNTGMVFQNYALWPHMSVEANVAYGLDERGVPSNEKRDRVRAALRSVRMEDYAARMPNQLSGGQQQRVALARALVIEPDVVLMDEPLSNLDAALRLEMRGEIRRIHGETGITMVYVTHDQKEALSLADRMAVMSMGRVEQIGSPREIYRTPANRFVATFIGEANLLEGRVARVEGDRAIITTRLGEFRARCRKGHSEGANALCMIRPEYMKLGATGSNVIAARVTESVYLGELEEYRLKAGELTLTAIVAGSGNEIPVGTATQVCFDENDALIF